MVSRILLDTIYYGTVINRKIIKKNGVVKRNDDRKYQELRKQKQKIDKQYEVAFENMINGVITSEQYSKKVKELNIIHDSLESEMNLIMVDLSQKAILEKELTRFLSMLSNITFEYDENNLELFEKLINKVIVKRPQRRYKKVNVNISYKFSK